MTTTSRINYKHAAPLVYKALLALDAAAAATGLEASLLDLIKLRASQINGCSFCIDLHSRDARKRGETEQRLYLVQSWREVTLYTEREQAALAWTEAVTLVADTNVPDDVYDQARQNFSDAELAGLTLAIATINAWNRFAVSFRMPLPGA